jgi:hypothetical protein
MNRAAGKFTCRISAELQETRFVREGHGKMRLVGEFEARSAAAASDCSLICAGVMELCLEQGPQPERDCRADRSRRLSGR